MRKMTYHEPHAISREEADAAFASGDSEKIAFALVNATFHDPDWRWIQDTCLSLAQSDDASVRQISVTCLGHIARIHRKLDLEKVSPVLNKLRHDPELSVRGCTEDAIEDIQIFMDVDVRTR
jgi:hypothetical protein